MKGFTKDHKFIPMTDYKKVTRKSRDPEVKSQGVRLARNGVKTTTIKLPDDAWKNKALSMPYLRPLSEFTPFTKKEGSGEKGTIISTKEQLRYDALPHYARMFVLEKVFPPDPKDKGSSFAQFMSGQYYVLGFTKDERRAIQGEIDKMTPNQLEWYFVDWVDQDLQVYGNSPPFIKEVYKYLPKEHVSFITQGLDESTSEGVRRVKILKLKLTGDIGVSNDHIDDRYRRIVFSEDQLK
jgi:hypothetical protein